VLLNGKCLVNKVHKFIQYQYNIIQYPISNIYRI
jgi:hypothetical protein